MDSDPRSGAAEVRDFAQHVVRVCDRISSVLLADEQSTEKSFDFEAANPSPEKEKDLCADSGLPSAEVEDLEESVIEVVSSASNTPHLEDDQLEESLILMEVQPAKEVIEVSESDDEEHAPAPVAAADKVQNSTRARCTSAATETEAIVRIAPYMKTLTCQAFARRMFNRRILPIICPKCEKPLHSASSYSSHMEKQHGITHGVPPKNYCL